MRDQGNPLSKALTAPETLFGIVQDAVAVSPMFASVVNKIESAGGDIWTIQMLAVDIMTTAKHTPLFRVEQAAMDRVMALRDDTFEHVRTSQVYRSPGTIIHFQLDGRYPGKGPTGEMFNAFYARFGESIAGTEVNETSTHVQMSQCIELIFLRRPKLPNFMDEAGGYFPLLWKSGTDQTLESAIGANRGLTTFLGDIGMETSDVEALQQQYQASLNNILPEVKVALTILANPQLWTVTDDINNFKKKAPVGTGDPKFVSLNEIGDRLGLKKPSSHHANPWSAKR